MEKYKIQSYECQDGKYGASFLPPQGPTVFTEPFEFGKYFDTKDEADKFTLDYLKNERGIKDENIEIY